MFLKSSTRESFPLVIRMMEDSQDVNHAPEEESQPLIDETAESQNMPALQSSEDTPLQLLENFLNSPNPASVENLESLRQLQRHVPTIFRYICFSIPFILIPIIIFAYYHFIGTITINLFH